jgi:hypothetical protein
VEIASADPVTRTFILDWFPVLPNRCTLKTPLVADIYINGYEQRFSNVIITYHIFRGYLDSTSPTFTAFPPYPPVYQYNTTALCNNDVVPVYPTFRTISKIVGTNPLASPLQGKSTSSLQQYPFDVYYAPVYLHVLDHDTGEYIAVRIARSFGTAV